MKKTFYIAPLLKLTVLAEERPIAASNEISGNSIDLNPGTMKGGDGTDAVKGSIYNVWNDDWSN